MFSFMKQMMCSFLLFSIAVSATDPGPAASLRGVPADGAKEASTAVEYKPQYTGFAKEDTMVGTMKLFAKAPSMDKNKAEKEAATRMTSEHLSKHEVSTNSELFSGSPLVQLGFKTVETGKHGYIFSGKDKKEEVYCQRCVKNGACVVTALGAREQPICAYFSCA